MTRTEHPPAQARPPVHTVDGDVYTQSFTPRFYEIDGQGVMFNMWYLGYVDAAVDGFFEARGLPFATWPEEIGADSHVAHIEIDWMSPVRYQDRPDVLVSTARIGGKSFTLDFAFRRGDDIVATGCAVYVTVAADGSGTTRLPGRLVEALGEVRPLRQEKSE